MKFLRLRNLIGLLLIIIIGVSASLYFIGGLKVNSLNNELTPFYEDEFALPSEELLEENKLVASNENFDMYIDEKTTIIKVVDKKNCLDSNDIQTCKVYETAKNYDNAPNIVKSPFVISYFGSDGSLKALDGYDSSIEYRDELTDKRERHYKLRYDNKNNSVQILYEIGRFGVTDDWFPQKLTAERFAQLFSGEINGETYRNPFLNSSDRITANAQIPKQPDGSHLRQGGTALVKRALYEILYVKGYQPFDENGQPMWEVDESGNQILDDDGNPIPVNVKYTREDAVLDNAQFGIETEALSPKFQMAIEYKLTNKGLEAKILKNSIKEGDYYNTPFKIANINFLHNFTSIHEDDTEEGFMVVPDGSGAVINFNNDKGYSNYAVYERPIYGLDKTHVPRFRPESTETLMMGMYGFIDITNQKGVLAIVEDGAANTLIHADVPRTSNKNNNINFKSNFRFNEVVRVGTGWDEKGFTKWNQHFPDIDYSYVFEFLSPDRLSYSGLAEQYREYLINKYDLAEIDSSNQTMVNLNMLGAFEKYDVTLGVRYKKSEALTSFVQTQNILEKLINQGINNINLSYTAWTKDGLEPETRKNIKVSKVLGGQKELNNLMAFLDENDIAFYPEGFFATNKGYDLSFGKMKYTTKGIGRNYAEHYPHNLATLLADKTLSPTYFISPRFYESLTKMNLPSYNKYNFNNIMVNDLGNLRVGDYSGSARITTDEGRLYQLSALNILNDNFEKLMLKSPFDYAFPYAKNAINVPVTSSLYGIFDYSIPFYQLVVSGLFDYSSVSINANYEKGMQWNLLKAIETGSNLYFDLSYQDSKVLLETDYTYYFYTYYENWMSIIVEMAKTLDSIGIHGGRLVEHQVLANNVAKVKYSNGLEIIVNTSIVDYKHTDGKVVQSNTYMVLE